MCILNESLNVFKFKICKGRLEKQKQSFTPVEYKKRQESGWGQQGHPTWVWNVARASLNVREELLLSWRSTLRGAAASEEGLTGLVVLAQKCFW